MSTIFAIRIIREGETFFSKIAIRHNGGRIEILNELIYALRKDRKVIPLDNTAQGIYVVKDLLKGDEE